MQDFSFIFGGTGCGYEVSLRGFADVYAQMKQENFKGLNLKYLIWIRLDGTVYAEGVSELRSLQSFFSSGQSTGITYPNIAACLQALATTMGCALPIVHDDIGEDGVLSGLFSLFNIPTVFNDNIADAVMVDKFVSTCLANYISAEAKHLNVQTPASKLIANAEDIKSACSWAQQKQLDYIVLKPNELGGSVQTYKCSSTETDLVVSRLQEILQYSKSAIVQEYIFGIDITVPVLEIEGSMQAGDVYATSVCSDLYSKDIKQSDTVTSVLAEDACGITPNLVSAIQQWCQTFCRQSNLRGSVRIDFRLTQDTAYFLEVNAIPSMRRGARTFTQIPLSLAHSATPFCDFFYGLMQSALRERERRKARKKDFLSYPTKILPYLTSRNL